MEDKAVQKNPVPEKTEKEKSLESIISLGENLVESRKSNRIVAVILLVAAGAFIATSIGGLTSPFLFPTLLGLLVGNQVYTAIIITKQKKLDGMKKTYESKFGAIPSN